MRSLELCAGYGGLALAVEAVFGAETVAVAEWDAAPSKILAHRWSGVPNLHDITTADWSSVGPVDVIAGGTPCQDLSSAGRRAGMRDGTRSGLWSSMLDAVAVLRPRYVVWENVRGALSACAHRVNPEPDGEWPASAAWTASGSAHRRPASDRAFGCSADAAAESAYVGHERGWGAWDGRPGPADGRGDAADSEGGGCTGRAREPRWDTLGRAAAAGGGEATAADADDDLGAALGSAAELGECPSPIAWGAYEPAIRRWEHSLNRPAPAPTEAGPKGGQRLSPRFVEWLMGLPAGWVTDVPGLSRNDQLKALGNGVVPQQAIHAIRLLLPVLVGGAV